MSKSDVSSRRMREGSARPRGGERAASLDLALQLTALRVEQLNRRVSKDARDEAPLLAEALQELDHAHAELNAAREELHARADEMLEARLSRELEWERYRDLFESAPVAYLETDRRGIVIDGNAMARTLLALPAAQYLIGKPLVVFVDQADRLRFRNLLEVIGVKTSHASLQLKLCPKRGPSIPTWAAVSSVGTLPFQAPAVRWTFAAEPDAVQSHVRELRAVEAPHVDVPRIAASRTPRLRTIRQSRRHTRVQPRR
jgi:PAS domain-containing protein